MSVKNINLQKQRGYAALFIGVVVLFILTLITIYLARSGLIELRTSANRVRYAEAFNDAEMRLEKAIAYLSIAGRTDVDWDTDITVVNCQNAAAPYNKMGTTLAAAGVNWRCKTFAGSFLPARFDPDPVTSIPDFVLATPNNDKKGIVFVVMTGGKASDVPDDGTTQAVVSQGVFLYAPGGGNPLVPPMMGAGNIPLNGSYNIVANPNGGGNGIPVSIWSKVGLSTPSGSAATCQLAEFNISNDCSTNAISSSAGKGVDIKDNDPDFPEMFEYLFGTSIDNYADVKTQSLQLSNCDNIATELAKPENAKVKRVWVNGNCTLRDNITTPIVLVVQSGAITINANTEFNGLLFAFGPKPDENAGDIQANGGAIVRGSIMSNDKTSMGININGTFRLIYDNSVMDKIVGSPGGLTPPPLRLLAKIPGSWTDYYD